MKKLFLFLLLLAIPVSAQTLSGVYVLAEGGFSPQTSMLSYYDAGTETFTQSIFNPGFLGLYPDGLINQNDVLFLCEQGSYGGSGKVYQLDSSGTVLSAVDAGTNPYSLAFANNKLYLTNGPVNNVSVLNADNLSSVDSITVGVYPQEILASGNLVFVANTSEYMGEVDSTISVIDAEGDTVLTTIILKPGISSLALAEEGYIFAGCSGDENSGMIYKISMADFSKVDSFSIAGYGFGRDLVYDEADGYVSFLAFTNDVIKYDLLTETVSVIASPELGSYYYGFALDPVSNLHFVSDAKDFSAQGSLSIYNESASLVNTFTTGIAPRRIVLSYSNITSVVGTSGEVLNFSLDQNYPNPFNPSTTISYQLPENGSVSLKIYNLLGKEVAELVNRFQPAGTHKISFNATGLASGIYVYQLKSGKYSSMRKMLLIK